MQEGVLILLKIFKALRAESYPRSGKVGLYQIGVHFSTPQKRPITGAFQVLAVEISEAREGSFSAISAGVKPSISCGKTIHSEPTSFTK